MEFEADRFAARTTGDTHALESALEKMAIVYPQNIDRRSGLHPSIRQRLANAIELSSSFAEETTTNVQGDCELTPEDQLLIERTQLSG